MSPELADAGAKVGQSAVQMLLPVLVSLSTAAVARIGTWLKEQTRGSREKNSMANLDVVVGDVVHELQQTMVPTLRSPDGKLSAEAAQKLKSAAVERVSAIYGTKGLESLSERLGTSQDAMWRLISAKIERAVYNLQASIDQPSNGNLPYFGGMTPGERQTAAAGPGAPGAELLP